VLRELHISGLGVIDDLDLELHPGLNVLTGETGAGKTMVTVGLALALGTRADSSLVRDGAKAARVQARFHATEGAQVAVLSSAPERAWRVWSVRHAVNPPMPASSALMSAFAERTGLAREAFAGCLDGGKFQAELEKDMTEGPRSG